MSVFLSSCTLVSSAVSGSGSTLGSGASDTCAAAAAVGIEGGAGVFCLWVGMSFFGVGRVGVGIGTVRASRVAICWRAFCVSSPNSKFGSAFLLVVRILTRSVMACLTISSCFMAGNFVFVGKKSNVSVIRTLDVSGM